MNNPDQEWWIEQSGEYVLGTLDYSESITFKKAAEHDENAQRLIAEWEQTFQPLAESLQPVEPPESVWKGVKARISKPARIAKDSSFGNNSNVVNINSHESDTAQLEKKLYRWRSFAGMATAASIVLASLAWVNYSDLRNLPPIEPTAMLTPFDSIAIIRNAESLPLWVVDTALADGLVRVTAIAPPSIEDTQSYELWLVKPDNAGVQSMGLIPSDRDESYLLTIQADSANPVAFAISLEPAGGSTEDVPTGPVLFQGAVQTLRI